MALLGSPRAFVGIDIGSTNIKLVELLDRGRRIELTAYALSPLESKPVYIGSRAAASVKKIAKQIASLLEESEVTADQLNLSLPSSQVFSTTMTLPKIADAELSAAVKFKARNLIPTSLNDMTISWHKQTIPGKRAYFVNVHAIPNAVSKWYQELAQLLKLNLINLEPEVFPLLRSLNSKHQDNFYLCDIGGSTANIYLIVAGIIKFASSTKFESSPDNRISEEVLQGIMDSLQDIIKQSGSASQINKVILVGGNAINIRPIWSRAFPDHDINLGNPWHELSFPQGLEDTLHQLGPIFSISIGLAKHTINSKYSKLIN